ncbi:MAG: 2-methylcitrate dehydratase PrpD, partial [Gammaproteobacteria bacterium]
MLTQYLADFAISTQASSIPESAREVARLSLLDWLAVGIAGCEEPVSNIVREMLAAEGGVAESTVFGQQIKLPARAAALANGTISHALDYDDTHFIYLGHPSVAVFPAAFAVAEKVGAGFEDFLDAALLGMESTCRIGAWLGREHYERGFHQTATAGSFGSTLAACRLLGLDVEQTCFALGQTASRASGLKAQFGTMGKPFHAGMAASNGVEAASLAQAGFVSCASAMEAEQGFAETHSVDFNDVAVALNGLGSSWVFETVQHKFHACCHGTHASLEAIGEMQGQTDLPGDSIDRVSITVHPSYLKVCNIAEPVTGLEAKFSLR